MTLLSHLVLLDSPDINACSGNGVLSLYIDCILAE